MGHLVSAVGPGLGIATNESGKRRIDSADHTSDVASLLPDRQAGSGPAPRPAPKPAPKPGPRPGSKPNPSPGPGPGPGPVFEVGYGPDEQEEEGDVIMELDDMEDEDQQQQEEVKVKEKDAEDKLGVQVKGLTNQQLLTLQALSLLATTHAKTNQLRIPADLCVIVVDTETTGLFAKNKEVWMTELAAVSLVDPSSFISSLVRLPDDAKIEQKASELSGITEEMCRQGKSEIEALLDLVVFVQKQKEAQQKTDPRVKVLLVAHNAPFDAKVIRGVFKRTAFQPSLDLSQVFWVDTLQIVRNSGAREKKNSLGALVDREFPAIDTGSMHRALADCFALSALIHHKRDTFSALFQEKNWKPFYSDE